MNKSYALIANFVRDSFDLKLSVKPPEAATTTGTGRYNCKDNAIYKVIGNDCWTFINWTNNATGEIISTREIDSLIMGYDCSFTANFSKSPLLSLTTLANPEGAGTTMGDGSYPCHDIAAFSATANDCWSFSHWTDNFGERISNTKLDSIEMTRNFTLTAHFKLDSFRLTTIANPQDGGTTMGDGRYGCKHTAIYSAISTTPSTCYAFINWTDEAGNVISDKEKDSIIMVRDLTLTANFKLDTLTLALKVNPPEAGTIEGAGRYECYKTVEYSVTANDNGDCWIFQNWTDSATGAVVSQTEINNVEMTRNYTYIANFIRYRYNLTLNVNSKDRGNVTGAGRYLCGDSIEIEAIPNDGFMFVNWTDESNNIISDKSKYKIAIKDYYTLIANFGIVGILEDDIYDISVVPNPTEKDFNIIFDNTEEQTISIELLDISGRNILEIYSGFASAEKHIYKVDKKLLSGTYFVRFVIKGKIAIRKVIVK